MIVVLAEAARSECAPSMRAVTIIPAAPSSLLVRGVMKKEVVEMRAIEGRWLTVINPGRWEAERHEDHEGETKTRWFARWPQLDQPSAFSSLCLLRLTVGSRSCTLSSLITGAP